MEIHFSNGVTGVVGPNGSGKSNISDGIKWVMGETSAKSLRGGSKSDVIFAGCETRKASTDAEAEIEFDNSNRILPSIDDDTVIITRKLNINGKTEFYINHQPVRLKDIQELFLDTGLGSNSYSMIGQEQTKKLLSEKTEDRRAIFEEAAGIVKMKNDKETTEKRLAEVEQDFVRLNDILGELKKQVVPLQKQSEKAKQYLSIKKALDETETEFLSFKFQRLSKEESAISESLNEKTNELNVSISDVEKSELVLKELKEKLKTVNETIFETQEKKSKLKEEIDSYQSQVKINEERIQQGETELTEVVGEIKEIEEKFSVSVDEFNSKKNRYQDLDNLISSSKQQKDELTKEIFHIQTDLASSKEYTEKLRDEITALYNEFQEAKLRFEQHNREEETILNELDGLKEKRKTSEIELNKIKVSLNNKQNEFQSNSTKLQELNTEFQFHINSLNDKQRSLEEVNNSLLQLETILAKEKTTLDSLESSLENFEGYFEGVKNILKNKEQLDGVLDVVSNLFDVNNGFEIALDSLLNAVSQNIVVDSIHNAKKAVNFLKEKRYGRATFIPLDDLSGRTLSNDELNKISKYKGISPALSVIKFDKDLEPLFNHLLGRYLIANDMDSAVSFYEETRIKTKIATLDGDILQPGTISGGTRNKKGLISKRKEIDVLRDSVKENENKLNKAKENEKNLRENIIELNSKKDSILISLEQERELNNQIKMELERIQREFEQFKNGSKEQDVLEKDLKYRYDSSKKVSSSLYTKHREKETLHKKKNEELTDLLKKVKKYEEILEEKKQTETNCIIDIEKFEEEKRNLTEFITEQENGKDSFEKRLEFLQTKKYSNETKINTAEEENINFNESLKNLLEQFEATEIDLDSEQATKIDIQTLMDETDTELKTSRIELEDLKETVHSLEIQRTNYLNDMEQVMKRAQEAYQFSKQDLLQFNVTHLNESATEREINALIKELKSIGSVNLDSVKDFEELNERYQKENAQLEDVKEAKKDLELLLRGVSQEMTERFVSTFKDIAKHFEKTFVELFGGGQAKLKLEDPKKPLTSHILIEAQPPGKKPKRMESLSGGEKNLTSCALVFAIIKAKPSPFVYFDELDAPLDDANVSRFAYYLKKLGEQTQFVVVTHRKGTMMAADSLFGVTQEERGVTTVFPYHLEQSETLDDEDEKVGS